MTYFILYTILSFILFAYITIKLEPYFHNCPMSHILLIIILGGPIIWLFMLGIYIYSFYVRVIHHYDR